MARTKICSVSDCERPHGARGYCAPHYHRFMRYGSPTSGRTPTGEPLRFFNTVVVPYEGDDCLTWPFTTLRDGYGQIHYEGKVRRVSRVACYVVHGPPESPDMAAAHLCGNGHKGCCNPRHLAWKTPKENSADRIRHGTLARGEECTHAKLTESNVLAIRAASGVSSARLARQFGVSDKAVRNVRSGATWGHVR